MFKAIDKTLFEDYPGCADYTAILAASAKGGKRTVTTLLVGEGILPTIETASWPESDAPWSAKTQVALRVAGTPESAWRVLMGEIGQHHAPGTAPKADAWDCIQAAVEALEEGCLCRVRRMAE